MFATNPTLQIRGRDLAVLRGLFESRVMTVEHIAPLYFDGSGEAAKKRLQKLKAAGLIGARRRLVNEPALVFLTRKGYELLRENGSLTGLPLLSASAVERRTRISDQTLHHELDVMDVKAAFHAGASRSGRFIIGEFSTWPILFEFSARRPGRSGQEVLVKPDGFIRIQEKEPNNGLSEHSPFFLEVDRSTELLDRLVAQARCYLDYYNSGNFAVRNGGTRDRFKEYPFRVLVVCKSAERRNNVAERLLQTTPPILSQVCLSTLEAVTADPFGAIWLRPQEYREATEGTHFDVDRRRPGFAYRHESERDALIEAKSQKCRLLAS